MTYTQQKGDADGFTVNFDGFALGSTVDLDTNVATTIITKQIPSPTETIDVGAGYEYENAPQEITFRTIPFAAPIYFAWADGTKADMYYKGGACYTTISMPEPAVGHLYENIVPTLNFIHYDSEGDKHPLLIDWYSKLSPENPVIEFNSKDGLADGVSVIAKRVDTTAVGGKTMYYLEIVTNQTEEAPLEITFADGYTMAIYCAKAASGNNVGVLDLYNVYKTTRYTTSELVDVITTDEDGIATSKLLPLGDYIVRELAADDNYLNDSTEQLVELKYKDQFTPLIWGSASMDNKYFEVQLDLSKVFETAFKSGDYQPPKEGQTVKFGLYSAEDITATAVGKHKVTKKTIKADTLMDVITVDYHQGGSVLVNTKLPEGNYYLKELEAPEDYLLSEIRYNFVVREDDADYSAETTFNYKDYDGIYGKFVLEEKNHVETTVTVESRFPMPSITIDGVVYPLDADFESEDGNIIIDAASDFTTVKVDTYETAPTDITLPNGKTLKVKLGATGNTFDYTVDGVTKTFTPTVTYTGYYAGYEELWTPIKGEDLTTYTPEFTLTGAGTDKTAVILKAAITHEPSKTVTTKEQLIDPAHPELGFNTVTVESGNLTPAGNQIFKHSAVITVKDDGDANVITGNYQRTSGKTTVTETLDPSGEITLNPKDTLKLKTLSGAVITVSMDKYGVVKANIVNTLPSLFTDAANSEVTTTGAFDKTQTFEFSKNVSLGRQDTSADKMLIKINSDNRDGFAVENDHKPEIEFVKVDKDDPAKKLSGAVFEIYSAKPSGEWTVEPDKKLGEFTTGADGKFTTTLDYGTYFWREIKAPSGYKALDYEYHKFRVIKGLPQYRFVVENDKLPETPGGGGDNYLLEITKSDMETGKTLAGAEFEIYGSTIVDGKPVRNEEPLLAGLVTGAYGKITISLDTAGTYFYHEVKAPSGYKCDGEYYAVEIKSGTVVTKVTMVNEKITEPFIKTSAAGTDGSNEIAAGRNITIVDTVSYYNLTPGETYTMKGTLMDKATGKPITVNGKKVTAEKTFTPKTKDGSITIKFTFDARNFAGDKLVVFERLYLDGKLIAKHTDINDIDQTVKITKETIKIGKLELTTDNDYEEGENSNMNKNDDKNTPKTGDTSHLFIMLLLALLSGITAALLFFRRKNAKFFSILLCFCLLCSASTAFAGAGEFKALSNNETVSFGYSQPKAADIVLTNTLSSDVTITSITSDDAEGNFTADLTQEITVPANSRATFAVALKTGKSPGTYTANYTFTDSSNKNYTAAASVKVIESFDLSARNISKTEWDYNAPLTAKVVLENHTTSDVTMISAESSNNEFEVADISEQPLTIKSAKTAEFDVVLPQGKDIGVYTTTITFTTASGGTYTQDVTAEIVKKKLTVPAIAEKPYVYNNSAQTLKLDSNYNEKYMGISEDYGQAIEAGRYAPVVYLKDKKNTTWLVSGAETTTNQTLAWDIETYKLTKPTAKVKTYIYDASEQTFEFDNFTESLFGSKVFTVSGDNKTNAGSTTVTVAINDKQNFAWSDGTNADLTFTWNMDKAEVTEPAAAETTFDYDDKPHSIVFAENSIDETLMTVSNNSRTAIGTQTVTVSLKDTTNYAWSNGSSEDLTFTLAIGVPVYSLPTIDGSYTYNGQTQHPELIGFDSEHMIVTDNSAKDAGSYSVKVSLKDKAHATWADTGSNEDRIITWTIDKASVTVAAINKTAAAGDPVPPLNANDYIVTGIIKPDSLGFVPTIAYSAAPNMSIEGTYNILVSGPTVTADNNYSVTYQNATLTIGKSQTAEKIKNVNITFDLPLAGMKDMSDAIDNFNVDTVYVTASFAAGIFNQETDEDITVITAANGLTENDNVYLKLLISATSGKILDKDVSKITVNGKLLTSEDIEALIAGQPVKIPFTVPAYRVHFSKGLGTGSMATEYAQTTAKYVMPESTFTAPSGKEFDKWQLEGGTTTYKAGEQVQLTGSINLIALYKNKETSTGGVIGGVGSGGGGGALPGTPQDVTQTGEVQKPSITANNGTIIRTSKDGTAATFTPVDDYIIVDVIVNGKSLGPVESVTDLKTGDLIECITQNIAGKQKELNAYNLVARSKVVKMATGKQAVKVYWYDEDGKNISFDGVEIQRSTKRYSGYKKMFLSKTGKYFNTKITAGQKYYYRIRGYVMFNGEKVYTPWSLKAIRLTKQ